MSDVTLPLDVALCNGNGEPICEDCVRRTAERPALGLHTAPAAVDDDCINYMEPYRYVLTEAGRKAVGK